MVGLEDENTQRHGYVGIILGNPNASIGAIADKLYLIETGIPFRPAAMHVCLLSHALNPMSRLFLAAFTKMYRQRFRIHFQGTCGPCTSKVQDSTNLWDL